MIIKPLETDKNIFDIFTEFKDENGIVFLDSCNNYDRLGKYSILAFNPFLRVKAKKNEIMINSIKKDGNPFDVLKDLFKKYQCKYDTKLPFISGAIGHFSYDLCHHIENLPNQAVDDVEIDDLNLGFYNGAIIFDHKNDQIYITDGDLNNNGEKRINKILERIKSSERKEFKAKYFNNKPKFEKNMSKEYYLDSINKIKNYIKAGDIYQVNMTQRFETDLRESPVSIYKKLREVNPAPFSGYMDFEDYYILSSSPERFIELRDKKLETRPIKGTRPRGKTKKHDIKLKKELKNSEKDQSELLMIVDLERNDFSKIAKTGTVKVPEIFVIEEYPTVNHLVSTVTCELDDKYDSVDVIKATFPGGSITGAPKIRAMEVIDELEPTQRNIYTGSIGYIDFNGDMDLNIVIRTILIKKNKIYFQVGGGIVWDSDPLSEYQESLDKAEAIFNTLSL